MQNNKESLNKRGQPAEQKAVIHYHRAYRRVTLGWQIVLGGVVTLASIPVILGLKIFFMPDLTAHAAAILQQLFAADGIEGAVVQIPFWGGISLPVLFVRPEIPSATLCLAVIGVALCSFGLLHRLPLAKPAVIVVNMLLFMVALYALFFLLLPGYFNESALNLAQFFMELSLVTGVSLPVLFWLVIVPLPTNAVWKLANILAFEGILFALFWLKYAVFVLLCAKATYLVTPLILFFLCSMLDIIYMIMLFSLFVSRISRRVSRDVRVWRWT
jgi:hypothetical protein